MHVTLIAALARNRVIGTGEGGIPWDLPKDRERFREFTAGKALLLGRVTFEEMEGWFSDQTPIVMTSRENYEVADGVVVRRVEEAITIAAERGAEELCVCGGAHLYQIALPYVDEMFLTRVETDVAGELRFPDYEEAIRWETVAEESHPADPDHEYGFTFLHLRREHPSSLRPGRMHWG